MNNLIEKLEAEARILFSIPSVTDSIKTIDTDNSDLIHEINELEKRLKKELFSVIQ